MASRSLVASACILGALAFLVFFASGTQNTEAATYKTTYQTTLSCSGSDKAYGTADDSCVLDVPYGAYGEFLTADIFSQFNIPAAYYGEYSQFAGLTTFGMSSQWKVAIDQEIPDGAWVGVVESLASLGLFGGLCDQTLSVTIPLFDCSTDNSPGNQIVWDAAASGENLTEGHVDGLPAGCLKYPSFVDTLLQGVKPRARYFGFSTVISGMAPTQLNFLLFHPDQLTQLPMPEGDMIDDLGYANVVILSNPLVPAAGGDALEEFCTPLSSDTLLYGRTQGEGQIMATCPPTGPCFRVQDRCHIAGDGDGDTRTDEFCGIPRAANPEEDTGISTTGSHWVGGYSESYPDADGDTIVNAEDECPFAVDTGTDSDGDAIDNVCDPDGTGTIDSGSPHVNGGRDQDGDGWSNQSDNCPMVVQVNQADSEVPQGDGIGDLCDPDDVNIDGHYVNDLIIGAVCIEAVDTDTDGWCDATENIVGLGGEVISDAADIDSTPEWRVIDPLIRASNNQPGQAPGTCSNRDVYDTHNLGGPEIDDDADGPTNWLDPNCAGMKLDLQTPDLQPPGTIPLKLPGGSVITSTWHELWPTYSEMYTALSFIDHDGDTYLSQGDQIDFDDGHDYHVDEVTITLDLSLKPGLTEHVFVEYYASAPTIDEAILADYIVGTSWHEAWPIWSNEWEIIDWVDNADNVLSASDQIILRDKFPPNDIWEFHVDRVSIDIIVTQKPDGDIDQDHVLDVDDNCPDVWNPSQVDRDIDDLGDACDDDDDSDRLLDVDEWAAGTDPKNVCSPRNWDINGDTKINLADVLLYKGPGPVPSRQACNPPADFSICEDNYRSD